MQPKFRFGAALAALALFAAIIAADRLIEPRPDRMAAPPAVAAVALEPVELDAAEFAPLALVGAWRMTSPEPRFGGISGIAVDGEELVAITDAGVVLRFAKRLRPRMLVRVADLPSGPGDARFKAGRDSEAIFRDPDRRGWWVAFENYEELWLFDRRLERALRRVAVPRESLSENTGIEGLAGGEAAILAFPEKGGSVLTWSRGRWSQASRARRTRVSDAAQIGQHSILVLERRLTLAGFRNALTLVRADGAMFRTLWRKRLPVRWRDNFEAVAAEPKAGGGYRLWI